LNLMMADTCIIYDSDWVRFYHKAIFTLQPNKDQHILSFNQPQSR